MDRFIDISGYQIKLNTLKTYQIENIQKDLTLLPFRSDPYTKEEIKKYTYKVYFYSDDKKYIIIPRYYGIKNFGLCTEKFNPEKIDVKFTKNLREKQLNVVDKCLNYIKKNGGGLLSVPCGFGKTVCAIYMSAKLGLKTLIIVHKTFLLDQWIQRILEFLDIDRSRIGVIRQKKCEIEGKDIVIGTIHTIAKKEYDIYDKFGFVIHDEAHHVCAKFFSRALLKANCKYTLSLTATPYRGDGLIKVMFWFLGGIIYQEKIKINKHVVVKVINYKSNDVKFKLIKKYNYLKREICPDTISTTTNIIKINERNDEIVNLIKNIIVLEGNRKILVLSDRINHLENLKDATEKIFPEKNICYYIGKSSRKEREFAEESGDIIFASYSMAHEGLDIKHLNCVVLASPKKDVIQSVGRIMRKILIAGDLKPLIIDISDRIDLIDNWAKKRYVHYKKCGYKIEDYYLKDNKFVTRVEYENLKLKKDDIFCENIRIHNLINEINIKLNEIDLKLEKYVGKKENKKVLDFLEHVDLDLILKTETIREEDFEYEILKDTNYDLDLENDIKLNNFEYDNDNNTKVIKKNIFKRKSKLFKKK
jgi:superfamily II DNA or RNA helicase